MTEEREISIRFPAQLSTVARTELTPDSQAELASAIAPTVEHIVAAAGMRLTGDQLAELQTAFKERGSITIRPGGENMASTLSVEANSLNYTSKLAPVERVETPIENVGVNALGGRIGR